jgi:hypothetical protein
MRLKGAVGLHIAVSLALLPAGGSLAAGSGGSSGPAFSGSISKIPPHVKEDMKGKSWHPGCPVPIRQLRLLTLTHWGYDGDVHTGRLVVRLGQSKEVLWVLRRLFNKGFPIKRMQRVDAFGGSDAASMKANNTSAFNCRYVAGTTTWSRHAFGTAIDINPVQNPYVSASGNVVPKRGEPFADRSKKHPGMIRGGGRVVKAFAQIGWEWGGFWSSSKDYMHFSLSGT